MTEAILKVFNFVFIILCVANIKDKIDIIYSVKSITALRKSQLYAIIGECFCELAISCRLLLFLLK